MYSFKIIKLNEFQTVSAVLLLRKKREIQRISKLMCKYFGRDPEKRIMNIPFTHYYFINTDSPEKKLLDKPYKSTHKMDSMDASLYQIYWWCFAGRKMCSISPPSTFSLKNQLPGGTDMQGSRYKLGRELRGKVK